LAEEDIGRTAKLRALVVSEEESRRSNPPGYRRNRCFNFFSRPNRVVCSVLAGPFQSQNYLGISINPGGHPVFDHRIHTNI
jgi:hypothetical protein